MRHGVLPKTLHVDAPSSKVDWAAGAIELLTEARAWERKADAPRRAGVSSFGISGTNAHVILEEAPTPTTTTPEAGAPTATDNTSRDLLTSTAALGGGAVAWLLSAKSDAGLRGQAERLHEFVSETSDDIELGDVALSLAVDRAQLEERAVIVGSDRVGLLGGLEALASANLGLGVVRGAAATAPTAFMFAGQGSQRPGMGAELYERFTVFHEALDDASTRFEQHLGQPLTEIMFADRATSQAALLNATEFTQPALFALEVGLFRLLESWGVRPDFVVGHSIGELAAAHVAGIFSLDDACALVAARGRLMGALPAGGAMVSIQASEQEVLDTLQGQEEHVSLAAINGPSSVVISGDEDAVLDLAGVWQERGRKTKRLTVSHAFHSHRMDQMLNEFAELAGGLAFAPPTIPIVSNLTGERGSSEQLCMPSTGPATSASRSASWRACAGWRLRK